MNCQNCGAEVCPECGKHGCKIPCENVAKLAAAQLRWAEMQRNLVNQGSKLVQPETWGDLQNRVRPKLGGEA